MMDYPIFTVPYLGGSMLIAIVAIVHVYIAHFAVGAGIFNALTETFALNHNSETMRQFLKDNSKFIILLPFIGGAVTGVGIWFTIALISPETTNTLIHLFVWAWAIEWSFFLLEIVSGYIYFYGWERMSHRCHCFVGWVYAISALLSLVVINGILTFMLTPGNALDSSVVPMQFDFWPGWLNPSYWPQLLIRGIGALSLAAMFAMFLVNICWHYTAQQRQEITNYAGRYFLPFALLLPAGIWFFLACPSLAIHYLTGGSFIMVTLLAICLGALALIGMYGYWAVVINKRSVNLETSVLLLALAIGAAGGGEFVREGIRKPYLIYGHVYSNGIMPARWSELEQKLRDMGREDATVLKFSPWSVQPNDNNMSDADFYAANLGMLGGGRDDYPDQIIKGKWIYDQQCLRCHSIDGYNSIRSLVKGWGPKTIGEVSIKLNEIKPSMPPFLGTIRDRNCMNMYMHSLNGTCTDCHDNLSETGSVLDSKQKVTLKKDYILFPGNSK
ncbi:MAG: cytochrome ubiquinol oxidase subunit I [Sedimentisphaerales bacterium]|nr:cytochrome ubiquinol oxidase subunit I [Sedimentisphaerales bacterium]MBN2843745.1 cytochrome ubiquinol oxidase subunit I [Sedimentisphaerales bacterium]